MTTGRRIAVGSILVLSGLALGFELQRHEVPAPPPALEWDWIGLEEDLDMLETLPVDGVEAWRERSDDYIEEIAAVDALPRAELERHRPEIGRLLAAAGHAAARAGDVSWPRFGRVEGTEVNVSWYRAARLVRAHPELGALGADAETRDAIAAYVSAMDEGSLASTDRLSPPDPAAGRPMAAPRGYRSSP